MLTTHSSTPDDIFLWFGFCVGSTVSTMCVIILNYNNIIYLHVKCVEIVNYMIFVYRHSSSVVRAILFHYVSLPIKLGSVIIQQLEC